MVRETVDLSGLWVFQPDPGRQGEADAYHAPACSDRLWRQVRVPVDFDTCHPALDAYEGVGWYRRWVSAPEAWCGKRVALRFEGANYRTRVWVNGQWVGEHADGFLPFELPIHGSLTYSDPAPDGGSGENLIAVEVDNTRRAGEVPGLQRGWRTYGGILRELSIVVTDLLHIGHVQTSAVPEAAGGILTVRAPLVNERPLSAQPTLRVRLLTLEGQLLSELESAPVGVAGAGTAEAFVEAYVPGVESWAPAHPVLYRLELELCEGQTVTDAVCMRVGFRTIEAHDAALWLNGERLLLTGFNRHEDSPTTRMCPDLDLVRRDLETMKDAGANFVRLCHYPHHPAELDLCDELGLLAMDEIPLYWWDGLAEGEEACTRKLEAAKRQLRALIQRDRNHPSVIFWSVSNETQVGRPEVVSGNAELVRLAQSLDPTRLAVHVTDRWTSDPRFEPDDVLCVNGYPTHYEHHGRGDTHFDIALSTQLWRDRLAGLHAAYPDKPILITEFGGCSFLGTLEQTYGEDLHADIIAHEYAGMDAPYVAGATVWCWADHPWPAANFGFNGFLAYSPFGVVTRDRRPKRAFWAARSAFRARQGIAEPARPHRLRLADAGYEVIMLRRHMRDIPQVAFPAGFSIRPMRLDEGGLWRDIERDAEPYFSIGDSLFHDEFGPDHQATQWRSYLVVDEREVAVGTISAWYHQTFRGQPWGMIHWVALRRSHWGRGLAKPMMTHAMNQLALWHDQVFLGTQTKRLPAIKIYLDFGFEPDLEPENAVEVWGGVQAQLHHPLLSRLGL